MPKSRCAWFAMMVLAGLVAADQDNGAWKDNTSTDADQGSYSWTNEKWTGDNGPWLAARKKLDAVVGSGQARYRELLAEGEKAYRKRPSDPQMLYRWAYLAYRFGFPDNRSLELSRFMRLRAEFLKVKSPRVPEFTRTRYLIESWYLPGMFYSTDHLLFAANRLLAYDPSDRTVKYLFAFLSIGSKDGARLGKALSYLRSIQEYHLAHGSQFPSGLEYYRALLYRSRFYITKDAADANAAIKAYENYLKTVKVDERTRSRVNLAILRLKNQASH